MINSQFRIQVTSREGGKETKMRLGKYTQEDCATFVKVYFLKK